MKNFIRNQRAVWNPAMFHGWGKTRRFFEGWYYKIVSPDEKHVLAFIPGISFPADGSPPHAFIQILDGKKCVAKYENFPTEKFQPSDRRFELNLGENFFSAEKMRLALPDFSGEISFKNTTPWPKMLGAPGIMGWYGFVPFMECFHGVVSLDHVLEGQLTDATGQKIDFSGGRGYLEKDWGRSFPKAYVWMQTNHFGVSTSLNDRVSTSLNDRVSPDDRVSLLASVAHIPWLGSYFIGFLGGFWFDGRLHRFATYTGAKKHLEIRENEVLLIFKNPKSELRMLAKKGPTGVLVSPLAGAMLGKINESMQATVEVEFLQNGRRIFEGTGRNAGLELAGQVGVL